MKRADGKIYNTIHTLSYIFFLPYMVLRIGVYVSTSHTQDIEIKRLLPHKSSILFFFFIEKYCWQEFRTLPKGMRTDEGAGAWRVKAIKLRRRSAKCPCPEQKEEIEQQQPTTKTKKNKSK